MIGVGSSRGINASFLVLIPKKGGTEDLKDFRPISLVGSLYKLLAKVLANRLKKKSGGGGILCKLDIEKAYDHWCIGTVNFSVLINGTSSGFFQSSRGLRQGDPLSPYLFVIVMEALSCLLKRAKEGGFLPRWQLSGVLFELASYVVRSHVKVEGEFGQNKLSSSYLGLPLGARFKEVAVWDEVEERLRKRLSFGKKVVYLQRGQTDFDSEHSVQYAYLLYVPVLYAKECEFEIGADQKGLSLGWWGLREEAPFSGLEAWVEDAWSHSGGGVWAPRFSRRLNDWEVFDVECFLLRLQGRRVCSDVEDQVVWTKAKDGIFFLVKSLYKALEPKRLGDFPSRVIWNSLVPPRVSFFAWEAMWKKALTLDRIQRRGFSLANRCYLCLSEE
ncbi:hypothetical protein CK203_115335 [Vitis vinifera]|uniref:Reverse transcriptase zinc-binding domain-containing protein n=1 Tax=Vitis vinifera TaxID=29760 RepID=A0A438DGJ3_VITVI|nr:hypothetical protein CK203_115335 [Vitis vinifera]